VYKRQTLTAGTVGSVSLATASTRNPKQLETLKIPIKLIYSHKCQRTTLALERFKQRLFASHPDTEIAIQARDSFDTAQIRSDEEQAAVIITTVLDDGFEQLPANWENHALGEFELLPEELITWHFGQSGETLIGGTSDEAQTLILPIAVHGDALGVWSRHPLNSWEDFYGARICSANGSHKFLESSGITLLSPSDLPIPGILHLNDVDLVVSQGAAQDEALGLFDSNWSCYAPSWIQTTRVIWLKGVFGKEISSAASNNLAARLRSAALSACTEEYFAQQALNHVALSRHLKTNFALQAFPAALLDTLYLHSQQYREASHSDQTLSLGRRHRDEAMRLIRFARLNYNRFLA